MQVWNKAASNSGSDAALRSTRTLEAHDREVEWHQESKISTASAGSARANARPGSSASEVLARPLARAASLVTVSSPFRVWARARAFVRCQGFATIVVPRSFGSFVRV